jgi:hypothetical protein
MDRHLTNTLPADIDLNWLREQLIDFTRFGHHHPYMVRVTRQDDTADGWARYKVEEEIKVLDVLPHRPVYEAEVHHTPDGPIDYRALVQGLIQLKIRWTIEPTPAAVMLHEHITLDGPRPFTDIFMKILEGAHTTTVEAIAQAARGSAGLATDASSR